MTISGRSWRLAELRNKFAHGTPVPKTPQHYIDGVKKQLQEIAPRYIFCAVPYDDKRLENLTSELTTTKGKGKQTVHVSRQHDPGTRRRGGRP
jgi:hypothetical protein